MVLLRDRVLPFGKALFVCFVTAFSLMRKETLMRIGTPPPVNLRFKSIEIIDFQESVNFRAVERLVYTGVEFRNVIKPSRAADNLVEAIDPFDTNKEQYAQNLEQVIYDADMASANKRRLTNLVRNGQFSLNLEL